VSLPLTAAPDACAVLERERIGLISYRERLSVRATRTGGTAPDAEALRARCRV
jgi:hypothetical protein